MNVLTVSSITTYIKSLLEDNGALKNVYVCGEISNFIHHTSGHMYFTLKDEVAQIKCIMYKTLNKFIKFKPENGLKVICHGEISVYKTSGVYQIIVKDMQVEGVGALTIAFEQLKEKLQKEGLFSELHKKD